MRIFYLDTSSSFLYFGLVEDDKLIFEVKKSLGKDMSKCTLSTIEEKFNEFKICCSCSKRSRKSSPAFNISK